MNTVVHIGDKPVMLISADAEEAVDIDSLCMIDHSNL